MSLLRRDKRLSGVNNGIRECFAHRLVALADEATRKAPSYQASDLERGKLDSMTTSKKVAFACSCR